MLNLLSSPLGCRALAAVGAVVAIGVLRWEPWKASDSGDLKREQLTVAFLPVT